jgi:hypothetical protein
MEVFQPYQGVSTMSFAESMAYGLGVVVITLGIIGGLGVFFWIKSAKK